MTTTTTQLLLRPVYVREIRQLGRVAPGRAEGGA